MKALTLRLGLLLLNIAFAAAQVRLDFVRSWSPQGLPDGSLRKVGADLYYMVNMTVGTPPQDVSLVLAPNTAGTSVHTVATCQGKAVQLGCQWGALNTSQSSTFSTSTDDDGEEEKLDTGSAVFDAVKLGGVELEPSVLPMVVAQTVSRPGALGLGLSAPNEQSTRGPPYALIDAEVIESPAYSMWFDDSDASSGTILLGAVDTSRFTGPLIRLEAHSGLDRSQSLIYTLAQVSLFRTPDDEPEDLYPRAGGPIASLNPADPVSVLEADVTEVIGELLGAEYTKTAHGSTLVVPCTARESPARATFMLGFHPNGIPINLSMAELIVPEAVWSVPSIDGDSREGEGPWCMLGLQTKGKYDHPWDYRDGPRYAYTLGGPLFWKTYMVFDLVNNEVAMAPLRLSEGAAGGDDDGSVVPFKKEGDTIPESITLWEATYGGAENDPDADDSDTSAKEAKEIGIIVGSVVGGTAIILAAVILWIFRRKKTARKETAPETDSGSSSEEDEGDRVPTPESGDPGAGGPSMSGGRRFRPGMRRSWMLGRLTPVMEERTPPRTPRTPSALGFAQSEHQEKVIESVTVVPKGQAEGVKIDRIEGGGGGGDPADTSRNPE